ncbi:MAG: A/G-specific adenine glycosylase [Planctomycetota bacterium]
MQRQLRRWYVQCRRDLPWRATRDPYPIWISEIMLQQTTVATVIPYFERFVHRFPDVEVLAAASLDEVLRLWAGLGYYRRARQLHEAARIIVREQGGVFPSRLESVLALPGIGRYTAGAILSMAYHQRLAAVDGNATRVLARLFAIRGPIRTASVQKTIWETAEALVPASYPGDHNQALMELGASLCLPRHPDCARCPLRRACEALGRGLVESLPERGPRAPSRAVRLVTFVARRDNAVALVRRPAQAIMAGLWETPTVEVPCSGPIDLDFAIREIETTYGLRLSRARLLGETRHGIMNRRIRAMIVEAHCAGRRGGQAGLAGGFTLAPLECLADYALTALSRKAVGAASLPGAAEARTPSARQREHRRTRSESNA